MPRGDGLPRVRFRLHQAGLLLCFLATALQPACFARNAAEGHFIEAEQSGRYSTYSTSNELDRIHLFRLNLRQFDEDIGGTVELFRVGRYATFELEPKVITNPAQNYFCTRLDRGISKGDEMTAEYRDQLNRRWRFVARIVDDGEQLEGKLERLAANGEVVEVNEEAALSRILLPEDERYYREEGSIDFGQLRFQRQSESVNEEQLDCALLELSNPIELVLPPELLGELQDRRVRAAIVMTKAEVSSDVDNPLRGIFRKEFISAAMEPFDVLDDTRSILLRRKPELLVDTPRGIGLATVVLFEDLPSPEGSCSNGDCNDRWDNLLDDQTNEPVLGYVPNKVLIYNEDTEEIGVAARNPQGTAQPQALFAESDRVQGWAAYGFYGSSILVAREKLMIIQNLQPSPADSEVLMEVMPPACRLCYSPSTSDTAECADCPPILPLLYL